MRETKEQLQKENTILKEEEKPVYDKYRAECKCPWNLDVSTGSRGLFYSYCMYCDKLTDIRGSTFWNKIKWTLRLWKITKRPMEY